MDEKKLADKITEIRDRLTKLEEKASLADSTKSSTVSRVEAIEAELAHIKEATAVVEEAPASLEDKVAELAEVQTQAAEAGEAIDGMIIETKKDYYLRATKAVLKHASDNSVRSLVDEAGKGHLFQPPEPVPAQVPEYRKGRVDEPGWTYNEPSNTSEKLPTDGGE